MNREEMNHSLKVFAAKIRLETMKIIASRGNGHVGGSLSIADALAVLYGEVMNIDPKNPRWERRDWCVLSKGHAGPAMYAALGLKGYFPMEDAYHLNEGGSNFPSHTDRNKTIGVDLTTGSLGQGISQAAGAALANRMQGIDSHVFVFVGDGEADEGQVWEAAQFASHYKLDHLIALIDSNGRQLDGTVDEVMSHGMGLVAKFEAFGWKVIDVKDGNDVMEIYDAIEDAYRSEGKPVALILNTIKGKGIDFVEKSGAHSSTLNKEQWDAVIKEAQDKLEALL
ncbi:MAG: transketolase [Erysipelotrichaceae bacterium]|nr:transketolase [Erysipelotrichaceae bacterium]